MTDRLTGKTAFITAAGQGIGRATAEAFVREGARVSHGVVPDRLAIRTYLDQVIECRRVVPGAHRELAPVRANAISTNTELTLAWADL